MLEGDYYGIADSRNYTSWVTSSTRAAGTEISLGDPIEVLITYADIPETSETLSWAPHHTIHRGALLSQTVRIGSFTLDAAAPIIPFSDGISVVDDRQTSGGLKDGFLIGADFALSGWQLRTSFEWISDDGSALDGVAIPGARSAIFAEEYAYNFNLRFTEPVNLLVEEKLDRIRYLSIGMAEAPGTYAVTAVPAPPAIMLLLSGLALARCIVRSSNRPL